MILKNNLRSDGTTTKSVSLQNIFNIKLIWITHLCTFCNIIMKPVALTTINWQVGVYHNKLLYTGLFSAYDADNVNISYKELCENYEWGCYLYNTGYTTGVMLWIEYTIYIILYGILFIFSQGYYPRFINTLQISDTCIKNIQIGGIIINSIYMFIALLYYTSNTTDVFDTMSIVKYDGSFGIIMLSFFIQIIQTIWTILIAKKLITVKMLKMKYTQIKQFNKLKKVLFGILILQLCIAIPMILENFDWQWIVTYFGMCWLFNNDKNKYIYLYASLTISTFISDSFKLSMMRSTVNETSSEYVSNTIYFIYFTLKILSLLVIYIMNSVDCFVNSIMENKNNTLDTSNIDSKSRKKTNDTHNESKNEDVKISIQNITQAQKQNMFDSDNTSDSSDSDNDNDNDKNNNKKKTLKRSGSFCVT